MPKTKKTKKVSLRPPIITIMGHVDHGKTTLLDAIRSSSLTKKEHGGITQHIGAYQIEHQGQPITFIDTPGHAAFSQMRAHGAQVTDIVILVVAANDGVKPQTIESIKHIQAAKAPIIVAINKIDLPDASADMVKAQLVQHQVFCEGYGGQTPAVEVSAQQKKGIKELLEMILLVSELEEIKANPKALLEAVIIESKRHKNLGCIASVIVKNGTLRSKSTIYHLQTPIKVKRLTNDQGKIVNSASPGDPVEVVGFKSVPEVGTILTDKPHIAPSTSIKPEDNQKDVDSDTDENQEKKTINIILKADTKGTLEAIKNNLSQEINLIDQGIGHISESDVLLAQATTAEILGFNINISSSAKKLAQIEKIDIHTFNIIYEMLEYIEAKILKLLEPTIDEEELGVAEIAAAFDIKGDKIAGCKIATGEISKLYPLHLVRNDQIITDIKIKSLKRGKENIDKAKAGSECGIIFNSSVDFKIGDMLKSYKKIK